ncbi:hypothetical protein GCM10022630_23120 [Thermobifida alba]
MSGVTPTEAALATIAATSPPCMSMWVWQSGTATRSGSGSGGGSVRARSRFSRWRLLLLTEGKSMEAAASRFRGGARRALRGAPILAG